MELELKHLAPYLPYKLQWQLWISENDNGIREMEAKDIGGICAYENWKPFLRPLSQLTEEIEHNGDRVDVLKELGLFKENVSNGKIVDFRTGKQIKIGHLEYARVEILVKYHFDVFALIEQGLALPKEPLSNDKRFKNQ